MKKRILLSLGIILLTTGCTSNYEIEIYNNQISEKMEYISTNKSIWNKEIQYQMTYEKLVEQSISYPYSIFNDAPVNENNFIKNEGVEYYKNTLIKDDNKLGQKLEYNKFTIEDFNRSSIVNACYGHFNILDEKDNYVFSTSLSNICFDEYPLLDKITIHLKTNHKVVSSNADKVDGYNYTWNITRENKDDAAIMLTIKKNEYIKNYDNSTVKMILVVLALFTGMIIFFTILYKLFNHKKQESFAVIENKSNLCYDIIDL